VYQADRCNVLCVYHVLGYVLIDIYDTEALGWMAGCDRKQKQVFFAVVQEPQVFMCGFRGKS